MALAADVQNPLLEGDFLDIPVADNVLIYEGALVMIDSSGYATPLSGTGYKFAGVAYRQADNTIVGHAAGGIRVKVRYSQHRRKMAITGAAQNMIGVPVHASADGTLTMTPATGTQRIGVFVDYISSGIGVVLLTPFLPLSLAIAAAGGANPTQAEWATFVAELVTAGLANKS